LADSLETLNLLDYYLAGEDQQQTNQPNGLAGGQPVTFLFSAQ